MLQVSNLTYQYPDTSHPVLKDVSFDLETGQVLLLAGGTGAGKSTLCYALAGFVPHFFNGEIEGGVMVAGRSMRESALGEWVKDVGLVLQNPFNQISGARTTVFEEVAFGLENLGIPREEMGQRVRDVLAQLEIEELAERSPYALSGGQQQRVAIASVLAMRPELLVLDEPTAQLDPEGTAEVFAVVRGLAERGTTVVLATHQLAEVAPFVTHALVLHQGEVVRFGTARKILRDTALATFGIEPPLYVTIGSAIGQTPPPLTPDEFSIPSPVTARLPDFYPFVVPTIPIDPVAPMPVTVEHISFAYPSGVQALQDVSVSFAPGQITAIIGANGAGKSTLARTLNGLLRPASGRIQVGDWDIATRKTHEVARQVGYLFQNPDDQLFKSTVWEEVAFAPKNFEKNGKTSPPDPLSVAERGGMGEMRNEKRETATHPLAPSQEGEPDTLQAHVSSPVALARGMDTNMGTGWVEQMVARALELTGLTEFAESHPYDLHPIQRRWVALASVLAGGAPILILDEPTSGFDLHDKARLAGLCFGLQEAGYTLLVVSHDMQLVAELADEVIVLAGGCVVGQGTPGEIFGDDALMSQVDGILPPIAQLAKRVGLPSDVVRAKDFVANLKSESPAS
jgi:energy-coupling factor transport system ATP-binding protein